MIPKEAGAAECPASGGTNIQPKSSHTQFGNPCSATVPGKKCGDSRRLLGPLNFTVAELQPVQYLCQTLNFPIPHNPQIYFFEFINVGRFRILPVQRAGLESRSRCRQLTTFVADQQNSGHRTAHPSCGTPNPTENHLISSGRNST